MIEPRFAVLTTTGYTISPGGRSAHTARPGVTATVYDRHYQAEMVSFRSEGPVAGFGPGKRLGIDGAILAAEEKARELNLWHAAQG